MSTRLDKAVRYLKRAHATNEKNVPRILMEGLQPGGEYEGLVRHRADEYGFQVLDEDDKCIYNCR